MEKPRTKTVAWSSDTEGHAQNALRDTANWQTKRQSSSTRFQTHVRNMAQYCRLSLFQDSDFAGDLRTQNQPREDSCVASEAEHLSPSVGCARNKRQYPTVLQNRNHCVGFRTTNGWFTCSRFMGHGN